MVNALLGGISNDAGCAAFLKAYEKKDFPITLAGPEGSLPAILLSLAAQRCGGLILAVVPTDRDANILASDLKALGNRVSLFPWWGTIPYREVPPLSPVFGERAKVLSHLVLDVKPQIIVAGQRAFLTPLVPPEYTLSNITRISRGKKFDTAAIAKTLVDFGYTRVPRVQMPGEFVLRGEVLDVFPGGDEAAYRVLFDFDTVESIKRFDPFDQSTSSSSVVESLALRPLKELVWTDDKIDTLEKNLKNIKEFSSANGGGAEEIIESLITKKNAGGKNFSSHWLLTSAPPSLII